MNDSVDETKDPKFGGVPTGGAFHRNATGLVACTGGFPMNHFENLQLTFVAVSGNDEIHQQKSSVTAQLGRSPLDRLRMCQLTFIAEVNGQLVQATDSQSRSEAVVADSQPAKKKRANKHNKRKKQQQQQQQQQQQHTKIAAETSATVDSAISIETLDARKTILKATDDRIDNDDPFYDQLKGIEAIKRGDTGPINTQEIHSQHHTEISKSVC